MSKNAEFDTRYKGRKESKTTLNGSVYNLKDISRTPLGINTLNMNNTVDFDSAVNFQDNENRWLANKYNNRDLDNAALDAHYNTEIVYDYFKQKHNRRSWDNQDSPITNFIHYGQKGFNNAFYNTDRPGTFSYGDGDGRFLNVPTSLDIVAHEYAHAITSTTAQLEYSGESGALNEGLSDIWAAVIEDWYYSNSKVYSIGEEIDLRVAPKPGLRLMDFPKVQVQPNTYEGKFWVIQDGNCNANNDYCGVHRNSGVLNYWFYLLSNGGSGINDKGWTYNVTGLGMDKSAQIVYRAQTLYLTPTSTYGDMQRATDKATKDLFGESSIEVDTNSNAWYGVGVPTGATTGTGGVSSSGNSGPSLIPLLSDENPEVKSKPEEEGPSGSVECYKCSTPYNNSVKKEYIPIKKEKVLKEPVIINKPLPISTFTQKIKKRRPPDKPKPEASTRITSKRKYGAVSVPGISELELDRKINCCIKKLKPQQPIINIERNRKPNNSICLGDKSGVEEQGRGAVAIGKDSGNKCQKSRSIAIGECSGNREQNEYSISVGFKAGEANQNSNSIAIGTMAGNCNLGSCSIAIGYLANQEDTSTNNTIVLNASGRQLEPEMSDGLYIKPIREGEYNTNRKKLMYDTNSGEVLISNDWCSTGPQGIQGPTGPQGIQGKRGIQGIQGREGKQGDKGDCGERGIYTIGNDDGDYFIWNTLKNDWVIGENVKIGKQSGYLGQQEGGIAIGQHAGYNNQRNNAISIGNSSGKISQGINSIAIGQQAGEIKQKENSIAIGQYAGKNAIGSNSIAIGFQSGVHKMGNNSICLNASGKELNVGSDGFFVSPINSTEETKELVQLFYNPKTKEILFKIK